MMRTQQTDAKPTRKTTPQAKARLIQAVLFLGPVAAYGVVMALSVAREEVRFGRIDLAVLALVLTYLGVACVSFAICSRVTIAKIIMITYCVLATLAVAEIPLRVWYPAVPPGLPWPANLHRSSTAGDAIPGVTGTIEVTVNSLGLRGPEVDLSRVETRILCVGGSTTECVYTTDKRSWPWQLQDKLSQAVSKSVFVGNAGKSGLLTIHHDYLLNHYALANQFQWVVVLPGANDMSALLLRRNYQYRRTIVAQETLTPSYSNAAYYRRLTPVRLFERLAAFRGVGEVVVQDPAGDWLHTERQRRQAMLQRHTFREMPPDLDLALETYANNLWTIIETARLRRMRLILMTQPSMYSKNLPQDLERLLYQNSEDGAYTPEILQQMMDAFNRTLIEVARKSGVDYIDLASMLSKDTSAFYDDFHFNDAGCDKISTIVADFIAERMKKEDVQADSGLSRAALTSR